MISASESTVVRIISTTQMEGGVGQVEPTVADRQPAVGIIDDGDALAAEFASELVWHSVSVIDQEIERSANSEPSSFPSSFPSRWGRPTAFIAGGFDLVG